MTSLGFFAEDPVFQVPENRAWLEERYAVVDCSAWRTWTPEELLAKCRSVEVILTGRKSPRLPEALAEDFGSLKYLLHFHGTIRHLCSKELVAAGLIVTNWGDEVGYGMAEGAMALLLCQLKQVVNLNAWTKGEGDDRRVYQGYPATLRRRNVGLYGFGPIGRRMATLLAPFEPNIAIYDPYAKDVPEGIRVCSSLRELFSISEVVSIHCGLNDDTRGSVNGEMMDLLPQGGIIINTARGAIVDEPALAARVGAGRLLVGADVICDENQWACGELTCLPGAVLTHHHIGSGKGYPPDACPPPRLPEHATENLEAYRLGQPLKYVVTAEEYDLKT